MVFVYVLVLLLGLFMYNVSMIFLYFTLFLKCNMLISYCADRIVCLQYVLGVVFNWFCYYSLRILNFF